MTDRGAGARWKVDVSTMKEGAVEGSEMVYSSGPVQ